MDYTISITAGQYREKEVRMDYIISITGGFYEGKIHIESGRTACYPCEITLDGIPEEYSVTTGTVASELNGKLVLTLDGEGPRLILKYKSRRYIDVSEVKHTKEKIDARYDVYHMTKV